MLFVLFLGFFVQFLLLFTPDQHMCLFPISKNWGVTKEERGGGAQEIYFYRDL